MKDLSRLIDFVVEHYDAPFSVVVEMMLNEDAQYIKLSDWETNQQKFNRDDQNKPTGREIELPYTDIVKTIVPGQSISQTKNIFLPVPFALSKEQGEILLRQILSMAKKNGSVKLSLWPAYGIDSERAVPAAQLSVLTGDEKSMAMQTGIGGAIYAVDGAPISRILVAPMAIGADDENLTSYAKWTKWANINTDESGNVTFGKDEGPPPDWLLKLHRVIDSTIKDPNFQIESARMKGFEGDIIFSTPHGDSVLVLSKGRSRAGYLFKKKVNLDGTKTDYDVAVSKKMEEFQASFKRKPRGVRDTGEGNPTPGGDDLEAFKALRKKSKEELKRNRAQLDAGDKRQPKLLLRDWLKQTENGYALRRDFRAEDIKRLLSGGINYIDGLRLADPNVDIPVDEPVEVPVDLQEPAEEPATEPVGQDVAPVDYETEAFEDKLEAAMGEPLMEDINSFLSVIEKSWSVDERGLFKYLQSASPEEVENWVDALDMAVNERGLGNRWVHALVEQTFEKLAGKIPLKARPIIMGMLEQMQAAPYPTEPSQPEPEELEADDEDEFGNPDPLKQAQSQERGACRKCGGRMNASGAFCLACGYEEIPPEANPLPPA